MALRSVSQPTLPQILNMPLSIGRGSLPNYWVTIYSQLDLAKLQPSTQRKKLAAIDRFYRFCERQTECGLDHIISHQDVEKLLDLTTAFFLLLNNEAKAKQHDYSVTWKTIVAFLSSALEYAGAIRDAHFRQRISKFEMKLKNFNPNPIRRPAQTLRALPADVVSELLEIVTPESVRNPFRTITAQWRNYCLVLLLLQLGLRRGEALLLPVGAVKSGLHPDRRTEVFWLNITDKLASQRVDRSERPSLKTSNSTRQIPVSESLARVLNYYETNYRGKQNHPFLFCNSRGGPLSLRGVGKIFERLGPLLSDQARSRLVDEMRELKITAHDLRHTCAVAQITLYRQMDLDEEEALARMRVFFGWSIKSEMPRHYARAYYETRLAELWNLQFDAHVDLIRRFQSEGGVG